MDFPHENESRLNLDFDLFIDPAFVAQSDTCSSTFSSASCLSGVEPLYSSVPTEGCYRPSGQIPCDSHHDHITSCKTLGQSGSHLGPVEYDLERSQNAQQDNTTLWDGKLGTMMESLIPIEEECMDIIADPILPREEIPSAGTTQLLTWYNEHLQYPYPSKDEMLALSKASGKTLKSTQTWYANARRRESSTERRKELGKGVSYWSTQASCAGSFDTTQTDIVSPKTFSPFSNRSLLLESSSVMCRDIFSQVGTEGINAPIHSTQQPRRKGKRREPHIMPSYGQESPDPVLMVDVDKPFFCTNFCGRSFREQYDWKKHEAIHLPEMWHCMPDNSPILYEHCAFCGLFDPRISHFKQHHNIDTCNSSRSVFRSFARKDKLRDHINRVHLGDSVPNSDTFKPRNSSGPDLLDGWFREPSDLATNHPFALWCGFCKKMFANWKERMDHVGEHLQRKETQTAWQPL